MYIQSIDRRYKIIKKCRDNGILFRDIVKILNITKQRIHQIYKNGGLRSVRVRDPNIIIGFGGRDRIRERVRTRDNYLCKICHKKWKKGERRFDVHHTQESIMGIRNTNDRGFVKYDRKNLDKLITLCHKCHLGLHWGKTKLSPNRNWLIPSVRIYCTQVELSTI